MKRAVILISYVESIKSSNLTIEEENMFLRGIIDYQLYNIEPEFEGVLKSLWILTKPNADQSVKYGKGGAPIGNQNARKTTENNLKQRVETKGENNSKQRVKTMDEDKDKDKDMEVDVCVELQFLIKTFNTPHYSTTNIKKLWDELSQEDRKYAFERADNYIKWETQRGKKKPTLEYYLKDKKWGYDLTIKEEKRKFNIPDVNTPERLEWYRKNYPQYGI